MLNWQRFRVAVWAAADISSSLRHLDSDSSSGKWHIIAIPSNPLFIARVPRLGAAAFPEWVWIATLLAECSPPRLYMRLGFSRSTQQLWNKSPVGDIIPLLEENGLVWHSHHQVSIHNVGRHEVIFEALKKDRRNAAWRHDGSCGGGAKSWSDKKAFTAEGPGRASALLCVSRLNRDITEARREAAPWLNEDMQHAEMQREPLHTMVSAGHSVGKRDGPLALPPGPATAPTQSASFSSDCAMPESMMPRQAPTREKPPRPAWWASC